MINKEFDVSAIWRNLADFWAYFEDRDIVEQLWRGYSIVINDLYLQAYQLDLSKCIHTIPYEWGSDYELVPLTKETALPADNKYPDFPYKYALPSNIKDINILRESPREVITLPPTTVMDEATSAIITPDGIQRPFIDYIYLPSDTTYDKTNSLFVFPTGLQVDTYKLKKDIDFKIDNNAIYLPKELDTYMWTNTCVRNLTMIYDNFGSTMDFYKEDSYNYWRQVQGLWFAFWNGSTITNIESGLNIIHDMPFAYEDGIVDSVDHVKGTVNINGIVYNVGTDYTIRVSEGEYVKQFTPLTDSVLVYDAINFPGWWKELFGDIDSHNADSQLPSPYWDSRKWDTQTFDAAFDERVVNAYTLPYFTFLIKIEESAWYKTKNEFDINKVFINAIKPAYTHYIFETYKRFYDDYSHFNDDNFALEFNYVPKDTVFEINHWDEESHPTLDDSTFDFDNNTLDRLSIGRIPDEFNDSCTVGYILDDEATPKLDSGEFDSMPYNDVLEFVYHPPIPTIDERYWVLDDEVYTIIDDSRILLDVTQ